MDFSYQEKSVLGSLVLTIGLFSYFFLIVFRVLTSGSSAAAQGLPFVLAGIVIAVVAVEVIYHILIVLQSGPEAEDERDRLIEAKASRIVYFVLATGCVAAVGYSMLWSTVANPGQATLLQGPVILSSLIICSFVLAEIVGFSMQLYYYRRGC